MIDKLLGYILNKYTHKIVKLLVNFVVSGQIATYLIKFGVTVDPIVLQGATMSAIEAGRNWAKQKYKLNWL